MNAKSRNKNITCKYKLHVLQNKSSISSRNNANRFSSFQLYIESELENKPSEVHFDDQVIVTWSRTGT